MKRIFLVLSGFIAVMTGAIAFAQPVEISVVKHTAQEQITSDPTDEATAAKPAMTLAAAIPPAPACPGDVNDDGIVAFGDLLIVLGGWGGCGDECAADLTHDAFVDFADLLLVLSEWGTCAD